MRRWPECCRDTATKGAEAWHHHLGVGGDEDGRPPSEGHDDDRTAKDDDDVPHDHDDATRLSCAHDGAELCDDADHSRASPATTHAADGRSPARDPRDR